MLEKEELLLPDPESPDSEAPKLDQIEGLSLRITQAMNHYQWEECRCLVCGVADHFARDCPHWETLMSLKVEGQEINALADSGSQLNTTMPGYVCQHEFPVLPLGDLVDHPLNLVGLGGRRTRPLGFMTLQVQVTEIEGYDEDVIFLVVPEKSEFFPL